MRLSSVLANFGSAVTVHVVHCSRVLSTEHCSHPKGQHLTGI
ncbi:hypothetical protein SLEP1_g6821 [Rubroshorea leprosula]|uniref:Uncharacterized protein n=1 Tax=Rubroshorea leprosula TaxID=152421 RepID=A0AAV5I5N0_9ROSI|nr:hypothetical protein SLEP1_g6821 [Rubroshorea leprosula]